MDCERIEELLPLYIDGDVPPELSAEISGHIAQCRSCAASLQTHRELEERLAGMSGILPDPGDLASEVLDRLGLREKRNIAGFFSRISIVWMISVLTVSIVVLLGRFDLATFLKSEYESLSALLLRSADYWIDTAGGWIAGQMEIIASMDPWLLAGIMIGFSVLIFGAGVAAAFRSLR